MQLQKSNTALVSNSSKVLTENAPKQDLNQEIQTFINHVRCHAWVKLFYRLTAFYWHLIDSAMRTRSVNCVSRTPAPWYPDTMRWVNE